MFAIWYLRQIFRLNGRGNMQLGADKLPISHNNVVVGENTTVQLNVLEIGVAHLHPGEDPGGGGPGPPFQNIGIDFYSGFRGNAQGEGGAIGNPPKM